MQKRKVTVSRNVINVDEIMNNFEENPSLALKEVTRIIANNTQDQQLQEMDVEYGLDICYQLKEISTNIFRGWMMKQKMESSNIKKIK